MTRGKLVTVSAGVLTMALLALQAAGTPRVVTDAEVMEVHRSALLIDTHNDVTGETVKGLDIGKRRATGHTDVPRLREGGVGAVFFAVYVAAEYARNNQAEQRALKMIETVRKDIAGRYPDEFELATSADQVEAAFRRGKIAALMGIEGGHAIENSLEKLRNFYGLGVRYLTLTHSNTNSWADSSGDTGKKGVRRHNGLTRFGRQVIAEMNRLGMIVDISHVSDQTFWDVLKVSAAPVFASHSSCRAISGISRNMTDQMIAALANKGGVIQINFGCEFISQKSADGSTWTNPALAREVEKRLRQFKGDEKQRQAERKRIAEEIDSRMPRATLLEVVEHIDRVVKIAGIDAVGIGSDFDGVDCVPEGLDDVSKFPNLTRALLERGYTPEDIRKIYGGNTLRLMRAVERAREQ